MKKYFAVFKNSTKKVLAGLIIFILMLTIWLLAAPPRVIADDTTATTTTSTAATTTSSTKLGLLSMGMDNLYLAEPGESAYLAIGAGFDVASYEKDIGSKGGKLSLTLHATAAARVTGNDSGTLVGGSVNLDLVKLFNGSGINFLLNNFKCVLGPVLVYDMNKGKPAYGGLLNFSYTTD